MTSELTKTTERIDDFPLLLETMKNGQASEHIPQVIREHLVPPGPVVVDVAPPDIDPGRDLLGFEDVVELAGVFQEGVFPGALPHADHDSTLAELVQVPGI